MGSTRLNSLCDCLVQFRILVLVYVSTTVYNVLRISTAVLMAMLRSGVGKSKGHEPRRHQTPSNEGSLNSNSARC